MQQRPVDSVLTPLDSEGWIGMDSQEVARHWGQLAHVPRPPIPDLDSGRWEWLQDQGVLPESDFFLYKEQDDAPTQTMRLLYVTAAEAWGAPVNVAKAQSFCRYSKGTPGLLLSFELLHLSLAGCYLFCFNCHHFLISNVL